MENELLSVVVCATPLHATAVIESTLKVTFGDLGWLKALLG